MGDADAVKTWGTWAEKWKGNRRRVQRRGERDEGEELTTQTTALSLVLGLG